MMPHHNKNINSSILPCQGRAGEGFFASERVWKFTGEVTQMKISGVGTIDVASLDNKTLYVSPYVVYNQQGYSKHYYAGAERVSSRIGGGTMYGLQDPITDTVSPITMEMGYPELSTQLWSMLERSFSDCLDLYTDYITYEPHLESVQASASQNYAEDNWYIYHSDHLGSSSFLTDASGDPTQHLQYLPFGENFIEQRVTTDYYTPYTFSAKERDLETGYSYFGARYYDADISIWLSVDPLADKYPSMSAFMYCAGNPVMLVDPDGDTISFNFFAKLANLFRISVLHYFADNFVMEQKMDNVFFVFAHGNINSISFLNENKETETKHSVRNPIEIIDKLKHESKSFKKAMDNKEPIILYIMSCNAAKNTTNEKGEATNLVKEISKNFPNLTVVGADGNIVISKFKIRGVDNKTGRGFFVYKNGSAVDFQGFQYDKEKKITTGCLIKVDIKE
jgi:RHS repeat-associated protein